MQTLAKAGLKGKPRKCQLFRTVVEYLGDIISEKGIAPDPKKIEKILDWPAPTTGIELLSFLGFCNYYRRLIPHFADLSAPLYAVAQEKKLALSSDLLNAFVNLKTAMCASVALRIPDPCSPFIVETDASNVAIGAILKQKDQEGEYPVSFYSQGLTKPERNYSTYERELYAIVRACEAFKVFLLGAPFLIRTDHKALAAIFTSELKTSSRVVKWVMRLQEFSFKIEYITGKENFAADKLSRIPWRLECPNEESLPSPSDSECALSDLSDNENRDMFPALPALEGVNQLTLQDTAEEQRKDPALSRLFEWIEQKKTPTEQELAGSPEIFRIYASLAPSVQIRENVLGLTDDPARSFRILVPPVLVDRVLECAHTLGAHEGAKKLLLRLTRSVFWPSMKRDVDLFVMTCPVCDRFRNLHAKPRSPLHPVRVGFRGEILAIDLVGGKEALPTTVRDNKYILVMIDLFSRYVVAVPVPNQNAHTITDAVLNHWILVFGAPRRILTDQGANFESAVFTNLCLLWHVKKSRTTAYHPATNGACERVNQTLKRGLQKLLNPQDLGEWDRLLPYLCFSYNTSIHSSTSFTPFFLMYGQEAHLPTDILNGRPPVENAQTPASFALQQSKNLEKTFSFVREHLQTSQNV